MNSSWNTTLLDAMTAAHSESECQEFTTGNVALKFYVAVIAGVSVSVFSAVVNFCVFCLLVMNRTARQSHLFFMIWITAFDVFMGIVFILLFAVMIVMQHWHVLWLYNAWFAYVRPMFATSHVIMVTMAYLVIMATLERYTRLVEQLQGFYRFFSHHRLGMCVVAVLIAVSLRGAIFFEIDVVEYENCTGFSRYDLSRTAIVANDVYRKYYMFYARGLLSIVTPFAILIFLQILILRTLGEAQEWQQGQKVSSRVRKAKGVTIAGAELRKTLRQSTILLVGVVSTWILANLLNITIILWEFIDMNSLTSPKFEIFYTLSADLTSVFMIFAGCCRGVLYYFGCPAVHNDVNRICSRLCKRRKPRPSDDELRHKFGDASDAAIPLFVPACNDLQSN